MKMVDEETSSSVPKRLAGMCSRDENIASLISGA
eukprot:CAMPEP_0114547670 /NCGR_PEP_ID=MMETSP0114-20121206/4582_1 /TAXON_ID=31324 /ORGANISM="Goniomonas sp, Strain m" /LENGTH=33 /DNA_ID= /DNA_START= /DNA_END= /DNA_ORIENTATION=